MFESIGAKSRIMQILPYGSIQNSHWNQYNPTYRIAAISDTLAWDGNPLDGEYVKAKALPAYIRLVVDMAGGRLEFGNLSGGIIER